MRSSRRQQGVIVCSMLALGGCVLPSTRRTHAENMAKAEAFKTMFDRDVKAGATFEEVLRYLKAHNLHFGALGLTNPTDQPPDGGFGLVEVEMFHEKSPNWYCGNGSVGLGVSFENNRLTTAHAAFWSTDCP